jgi:hypothetical protein
MKDSNDAQTIDWVDDEVANAVQPYLGFASPKTLRSTKR